MDKPIITGVCPICGRTTTVTMNRLIDSHTIIDNQRKDTGVECLGRGQEAMILFQDGKQLPDNDDWDM